MKFSRYLEEHIKQPWRAHYLNYAGLKKLLLQAVEDGGPVVGPQQLSISFNDSAAARRATITSHERFFVQLESQVAGVNGFTQTQAQILRRQLQALEGNIQEARRAGVTDGATWGRLVSSAQSIGREYLDLEKYVNLNYAALQKILKKHDKRVWGAPCWAFYRRHVSSQAWVRGDHHDIQVTLARVFTELHAAQRAVASSAGAPHPSLPLATAAGGGIHDALSDPYSAMLQQNLVETSRKFWVRLEDVAELQYIVVQHLPLVSAIPDDHHGDEGGQTPAGSVTPRSMPEEGRSSVDVGRPTYQLGPQPQSGFLRSSLLPFSRAASTSNMPSGAAGNHARPGQQRSTAATAATSTGNTRAPGSVTPSKHHSGPSSRSAGISGGQAAQDVTQEPNIGDPSVVNLLYLDNPSLEMYHQLLYGRPYSTLVRVRWVGDGPELPEQVQIQRKIYREGWRPDTSVKDSFPVQEYRVSEFLSGRWTFADARKFALRLGRDMQQHRQQQQHQQGSQRRWEPGLPGSGATGGYAGAAGKSTGRGIGASSSAMTLGPVTGGFGMSGGGQEYESMVAEMEATQREYALFKTFTEVQRLIETKALQPMVRVTFRQLVFADPQGIPVFPDLAAADAAAHEAAASASMGNNETVSLSNQGGQLSIGTSQEQQPLSQQGAAAPQGEGSSGTGIGSGSSQAGPWHHTGSALNHASSLAVSTPGSTFERTPSGALATFLDMQAGTNTTGNGNGSGGRTSRLSVAHGLDTPAVTATAIPSSSEIEPALSGNLDIIALGTAPTGASGTSSDGSFSEPQRRRGTADAGAGRPPPGPSLSRIKTKPADGGGGERNGDMQGSQVATAGEGAGTIGGTFGALQGVGGVDLGHWAAHTKVMRVQLDTDIKALLEYSYDGQARIAHGLWRQIRHADAVDFPYVCCKISIQGPGAQVPLGAEAPLPPWLQSLVDEGKLVEVPDFSKYLFACAGLLPDMVRAVPVWIDDPLVQRCLSTQFFPQVAQQAYPTELAGRKAKDPLAHQESHRAGTLAAAAAAAVAAADAEEAHHHREGGASSGALKRKGSARHPEGAGNGRISPVAEPPAGGAEAGGMGRLPELLRSASRRLAAQGKGGVKGWQLKLLARQQTLGAVYAPQAVFIDPSLFLRNERVFISWLTMSITLASLACTMFGFSAAAHRDVDQDPLLAMGEVTAFTLLLSAIIMCGYSLVIFIWRSMVLYDVRSGVRIDDIRGSLVLCLLVSLTLGALFIMNIYDLVEALIDKRDGGGGGDGGGAGGDDSTMPVVPSQALVNALLQQGSHVVAVTAQQQLFLPGGGQVA